MASYQLTPALNITAKIEYYRNGEGYKALLFIVPVEAQASITLDYEHTARTDISRPHGPLQGILPLTDMPTDTTQRH